MSERPFAFSIIVTTARHPQSAWLQAHHASATGLLVGFREVGSGHANMCPVPADHSMAGLARHGTNRRKDVRKPFNPQV